MRWTLIVVLLIALALGAAVVQNMNPLAQSQDPTPAIGEQPDSAEAGPTSRQDANDLAGATVRGVASGSLEVLAPGTANLTFGRMKLAPGAGLPFNLTDPSAVLVYTSAGELTFRVATPMTVARREDPGLTSPSEPEAVAADTPFTLRRGDSALFPPAIAGEVRNDSPEEGVAWVVNLTILADAVSTPTP